MLFNSLHFLLFLPAVTALYYALPYRFRWILILLASCYFYMAFIPVYILVLFLIILIDFTSGIFIERSSGRKRKLFLVASLASNILLLAFFKYFNFAAENLSSILEVLGMGHHIRSLDIILPIGLSFHTFQSMSYTIEVYRGKQKAERHLGYFADYVLFFPQMVAGPIERYEHLGEGLKVAHPARYGNLADGFRLVLFGLFVKMAIADNIAPYVNAVYLAPLQHSPAQVLLATVLFSFQIYADFFGYSTIALGSARALGISIMDNFNTPYLSRSISEFWSRWHISLSTWFRDYLYIPLGGNRVSVPRWSFNIMFVFMVSGLWHGADWTFVIWGAIHGAMLLLEGAYRRLFPAKTRDRSAFADGLLTLKTFAVVTLAWVFFRAHSFSNAVDVFRAIFSTGNAGDGSMAAAGNTPDATVPLCAAAVMMCCDALLFNSRFDLRIGASRVFVRWSIYTLILFGLMALSGTQKFAFIYFQF
jgi:alginate O-acetyltransferase complex protein AlgI